MSVIIVPRDLDERIASAAESFWTTRKGQLTRQSQGDTHDQ